MIENEEKPEVGTKLYFVEFDVTYNYSYEGLDDKHGFSMKELIDVETPVTREKFLNALRKLDKIKEIPNCYHKTVNFQKITPL